MLCRAIPSFDAGYQQSGHGCGGPDRGHRRIAPGIITIITIRAAIAPRAASHQGAASIGCNSDLTGKPSWVPGGDDASIGWPTGKIARFLTLVVYGAEWPTGIVIPNSSRPSSNDLSDNCDNGKIPIRVAKACSSCMMLSRLNSCAWAMLQTASRSVSSAHFRTDPKVLTRSCSLRDWSSMCISSIRSTRLVVLFERIFSGEPFVELFAPPPKAQIAFPTVSFMACGAFPLLLAPPSMPV